MQLGGFFVLFFFFFQGGGRGSRGGPKVISTITTIIQNADPGD